MTYATQGRRELAKEGIDVEMIDLRTIRPMDTRDGHRLGEEDRPARDGRRRLAAVRRRRRDRRPVIAGAFDYLDAPSIASPARTCRCPMPPTSKSWRCRMSAKSSRRSKPSPTSKRRTEGAMPINITMPALSPTMEEGNLAKWLVKEGDKVKSGDVIAEIETDKATMEVEAVDEGVVAKLVVPPARRRQGQRVIAILAAEGEDVKAAAAAKGGGRCLPRPRRLKRSRRPKLRRRPQPLPSRAGAATPLPRPRSANALFASPLARRIAKEAGIDLAGFRLRPAWPRGQERRRGCDRRRRRQGLRCRRSCRCRVRCCRAKPRQGHVGRSAVLKLFEPGSYELVPHDGMRKTIAKRLQESKQTIPHFYVSVDCELDALLALRAQLNAALRPRPTRTASRPTSCRSTTWSSRRWRWRCATCRMPTCPGPTATWSSTSTPMSASPSRSRAA
jgi:biotin carboxyl carrier protein